MFSRHVTRWLLALFVQTVLLLSAWDIWREEGQRGGPSPVDGGWPSGCHPVDPPPASRAVILVVDGLRAQRTFGPNRKERSLEGMYLRDATQGRVGVSLAAGPVSKKRCHTAIVSGVPGPAPLMVPKQDYPSYDTLFDRSDQAFLFATNEVADIFKNTSTYEKWVKFIYPNKIQVKFSTDTLAADTWLLDSLESAFANPELEYLLRLNKTFFYIQLSSIDLASRKEGHSSWRVDKNLDFINQFLLKLTMIFEKFYEDQRTLYIFTSDSGTESDFGLMGGKVKGRESPERMHTPFVVWGAGVNKTQNPPKEWTSTYDEDKYDLRQIDIAPLVATLLGIPIPAHSEGFVPEEYLDFEPRKTAASCVCNAIQVSDLFVQSREKFLNDSLFVYKSNNPFATDWVSMVKFQLQESFSQGDYDKTVNTSRKLAVAALAGLNFNRIYFRQILIMLTMFLTVFWVFLLFLLALIWTPNDANVGNGGNPQNRSNLRGMILIKNMLRKSPGRVASDSLFFLIFAFSLFVVFIENWPIRFYFYNSFPVLVTWYFFNNLIVAGAGGAEELKKVMCTVVFYLGIVQFMVWFFDQPLAMYILMALFYLLTVLYDFREVPMVRVRDWMLTPMIPLVLLFFSNSVPSQSALFLYVVLWVAASMVHEFWFKWKKENSTILLVATFAMAGVVSRWLLSECSNPMKGQNSEDCSNSSNEYYISWLSFTPVLLTRFVGSDNFTTRLVEISLSLGVPYFLFSFRLEPIALFFMALHAFTWLVLENSEKYTLAEIGDMSIRETHKHVISPAADSKGVMMRRGLHIVIYLVVAYFCTGHSSSVPPVQIPWFEEYLPSYVKGELLTATLILKHLVMVLTLVSFFVVMVRISGGPLEPHLIFALFFANSMILQTSIKFMMLPYSENDFPRYLASHIVCLVLPFYILVSAPLALLLTGPSFFLKTKVKEEISEKVSEHSRNEESVRDS